MKPSLEGAYVRIDRARRHISNSSYSFGGRRIEPFGARRAIFPRIRSKSFRLGVGILAPFVVSSVRSLSSLMI